LPVLLLKSFTLSFERLVIKIQYGVGPSLLFVADGFRRSGAPYIAIEKFHPRFRAPGRQNPMPLLVDRYEGPNVELPAPFVKLDLVGLFNSGPFTVHGRLPGGRFFCLLYIAACGNHDFTFNLLFFAFDTLAPSPLLLRPISFIFSSDLSDGGRTFYNP
jgi:hypothetical protein